MTYIKNVLVCMAAPLLVALLLLRRKQRPLLLFCLAGMGMCLLAAYLNTFFAQLYAADALNAATQIAPVVEEIMKLLLPRGVRAGRGALPPRRHRGGRELRHL